MMHDRWCLTMPSFPDSSHSLTVYGTVNSSGDTLPAYRLFHVVKSILISRYVGCCSLFSLWSRALSQELCGDKAKLVVLSHTNLPTSALNQSLNGAHLTDMPSHHPEFERSSGKKGFKHPCPKESHMPEPPSSHLQIG